MQGLPSCSADPQPRGFIVPGATITTPDGRQHEVYDSITLCMEDRPGSISENAKLLSDYLDSNGQPMVFETGHPLDSVHNNLLAATIGYQILHMRKFSDKNRDPGVGTGLYKYISFVIGFRVVFADSVFTGNHASDIRPTYYGETWAEEGFRSCRHSEDAFKRPHCIELIATG